MIQIERTELPGVGMRYAFTTRDGRQLGVILHRTGDRELILYCRDDPDRCAFAVRLDFEEAAALGEILVGSQVEEDRSKAHQAVAGLAMDWLPVPPASSWVGSSLGDLAGQGVQGASVVALIRGTETIPGSQAETVIEPGDTIVAVGTVEGLADLARRLEGGQAH